MLNITTFLDTNAIQLDKTALVSPSLCREYTYKEILSEVIRIASGLASLGISPRDRVCIYMGSSPEYLISIFAIWRLGAVFVPANNSLKADEIYYTLYDAGVNLVITDSESLPLLKSVANSLPELKRIILVSGEDKGTICWNNIGNNLLATRPSPCSHDTLCHIQYTAGTTGRPKGAMLTHGNWMAALEAEREVLSLNHNDVYLGIYPMAHVGISWGISVLRAGGTFVIMERFSPDKYLSMARDYNVTVLAGMPPVLHSLNNAPPGAENNLHKVRVIISGGGQLLPSIWEEFSKRYLIPVANSYGLSETIVVGSGTAALPWNQEFNNNFTSVGVPVGYTELKIVDSSDPSITLKASESGEIAIRGPAVASGYWNQEKETEKVFLSDGWFLTGDIGFLDGNGRLSITDRKKDMIIMSGWKIYPTEVENAIIRHPKIMDVAVFGIPHPHKGEIPIAAVVSDEPVTLEDLQDFCSGIIAGYKIPRGILIVESLPRAHGWKLLRRTLREKYLEILEKLENRNEPAERPCN